MQRIEVPYLVVGAGPVGLMGGLLLARQGRPHIVLERRRGAQRAPAAHVVNARTFEICRQAGIDSAAIDGASKDPADAGYSIYVTTLTGEEIGRLPFEQQGKDCLRHTPTPLRNLSQHRFEPILADTLSQMPESELRYGHQWESVQQDENGVTSTVRDLEAGKTYEIRSRYVIAADGAGSPVRRSLGIEMEGPPNIQSFLMIHLKADLRALVADRPGILYWVMDPEVGGVLVAHDIDHEWVYMYGFDPDKESAEEYSDERCHELAIRAIGKEASVRVLGRGTWNMSAQVAKSMRDRRVFLAGDSAHRFPPTGGMGLNTGIQDVHGLVWKLCAVEDGWAGPPLLDTYELERRPVAEHNTEQSLKNALKMMEVPQALGVLEDPTTARMKATLVDPAGRRAVEDAIANQAEHFDMLGLQLGYCYTEGALVPDGSQALAINNPVRDYVASSRPGARLPHAWLKSGSARVSSLDLVRSDSFTLLSWGEDDVWAKAASTAAPVPLSHLRIGIDVQDIEGHWESVCGIEPGGAVLVRPDQHVAWRAASRSGSELYDLGSILKVVLNSPV